MTVKPARHLMVLMVTAILAAPLVASAQEATLLGTVTDSTGGVLPGVTVTAVHEASGNTFTTVTDERGMYRLPVRTGGYRMTGELAGFTTVTRAGLELLLSQQATVNFQMRVSDLQETVTVTGEAPLIDVTESRMSGNIDPRQIEELPVNGRNWLELTMLAPGSRTNSVGETATEQVGSNRQIGDSQMNIDGQQVTNLIIIGTREAPKVSRDAIAEFEFVANRFDATQGRSIGTQVNVITKSGTNTLAGTVSGYFRDDRFNAADFVAKRVLPYSNQQVSTTLGGPILRDRLHYFGNYEFEREPSTIVFTTPYPSFNIDQASNRRDHKVLARVDAQFSTATRLSVRGSLWDGFNPYTLDGSPAISHPSDGNSRHLRSDNISTTLTQTLGTRAFNRLQVGYAGVYHDSKPVAQWPNHWLRNVGVTVGGPAIQLTGFNFSGGSLTLNGQVNWSLRDDLQLSVNKAGRHDIKVGGEYIRTGYWIFNPGGARNGNGTIDARGGPIPANFESLFPVWNDVSTWNLAALSPITRSWLGGIGNFRVNAIKHVYGGWIQDDWQVAQRLTINLGLRYDYAPGSFGEDDVLLPFLPPGRKADSNNIGPRVGFAFSLNDRTVVRGGGGLYYGEVSSMTAFGTKQKLQIANPSILNDGRPDFAVNPFNGPQPSFEEAERQLCSIRNVPGCIRKNLTPQFPQAFESMEYPYAYQASAGVQRQVASTMAVEADYIYTGAYEELYNRNINLSYNPATGANYPFTDISRRPYPDWGVVVPWNNGGESRYHALQTALTKRFSQNWQAAATYLLSGYWNMEPAPEVGFPLAPDLGGEYTLAATDQRHRATLNGIVELKYGFQVSGLYFFGSGKRFSTNYGGDLRNEGQGGSGRLRPDGTIVPRNNFVGAPVHKVDLRIQRRQRLAGLTVDGMFEVFNLFNHENYGNYTTQESSPLYGQPTQNPNLAFAPRMLQLGFRVAF